MTYRTLATWQKAVLTVIWIAAIGSTIGLVLSTPTVQTGGLAFILLTVGPFVLALLASLPFVLNPRGPERSIAAQEHLAVQNDAFSVVSARIRIKTGEVMPIRVIIPTVFGSDTSLLDEVFTDVSSSSIGSPSQHVAREETLDFALQAAREQYPDCEWAGEPDIREANEEESADALRSGVNLKYV